MKTHILRALSEKPFFNLWIGEVFTQISINIFNFFLILIVFKLTHSNTAVSGVVLSFTIPAIIFGSLAGILVDRWSKKKVLILTNLIRAVLLILLAFYLDNLFVIYVISFFVAIFTQFFIPAESPMVPLTVKREQLLSANALFGMGIFGSILVAYALSGPLIIFAGTVKTLIILAIMLFVGAIFISIIKVRNEKNKEVRVMDKRFNLIKDVKYTLILISKTKEISHSIFFISASQVIILILATIAPGYANQVLGINVEEFPLIFVAPAALGMIVGAIVLVNIFHSHAKQKIITTGIFISGIAMLLLPYGSKVASRDFIYTINSYLPNFLDVTILHIMAFLAFVLGAANSLIFVPANTIIQEKTTDEFRGKIYGLLNSIAGAFSLVPIIIVGGLSDLVGVGNVVTGIGVGIILFGSIRLIRK
jgi:MFS family permease